MDFVSGNATGIVECNEFDFSAACVGEASIVATYDGSYSSLLPLAITSAAVLALTYVTQKTRSYCLRNRVRQVEPPLPAPVREEPEVDHHVMTAEEYLVEVLDPDHDELEIATNNLNLGPVLDFAGDEGSDGGKS